MSRSRIRHYPSLRELTIRNSHDRNLDFSNGNGDLPLWRLRRSPGRTPHSDRATDHLPDVHSATGVTTENMIIKRTCNSVAAWDFSRWFVVVSPLIGVLLGFFGAYFVLH
jgi:hypothetical protein